MASHTFTVDSSLTATEAFALLVDLERVDEWDAGIIESVRLGSPGEVLGSRFDVTVNGFDGSPTSVVYEIVEVDAPHRFVMIGANDAFRAVDELTLVESERGCVLTYQAQLELLGDEPPLTDPELDALFAKIAAVPEVGLARYLNHAAS